MQIEQIPVGPIQTNAFLVHREGAALLIDPGAEGERLAQLITELGLNLEAILITHGHYDHIGGVEEVKRRFPRAEVVIHPLDAICLTDPQANLSIWVGEPIQTAPADRLVADGERFKAGLFEVLVRHLPGHTVGHVVYEIEGYIFGGDTLFQEGVGRWDLPGGDGRKLIDGIRSILLEYPDATPVYPGHGPATTIGHERLNNPYLDSRFEP